MIELLLQGDVASFIIIGIALVIAIALHEFGHALAADLQGDPTPRLAGRLKLNPLAHLDPIGTFMLVMVGFGWGKPVPFSEHRLRNRRSGVAIVALAGPMVNLALALVAAGLFTRLTSPGRVQDLVFLFLYINVILAIFNLIPIPPLDGSRILTLLLPPSKHHIIFFLDKWGFLILIALVFFVLPGTLGAVAGRVSNLLLSLFGSPAGIPP